MVVLAAGPLLAPDAEMLGLELPGPAQVLRTRAMMLEAATPAVIDSLDLSLLNLAVGYLTRADQHTAELVDKTGTRVTWQVPRVVIAALEGDPGGGALSLDVLSDVVDADGDDPVAFQTARGLASDLIETRVIYEATQVQVISASTVLSHAAAPDQTRWEGRIEAVETEAFRLLAEEAIGTRVRVSRLSDESTPRTGTDEDMETKVVELLRAEDGLVLFGVGSDTAAASNGEAERFTLVSGSELRLGGDARQLAIMAEDALSRAGDSAPGLIEDPLYALRFDLDRALPLAPLPLVPGTTLSYRGRLNGQEVAFGVLVTLENGRLTGTWVDPRTGRTGGVGDGWEEPLIAGDSGLELAGFLAPAGVTSNGVAGSITLGIGETPFSIESTRHELDDGSVLTLLASEDASLILEWQHGETLLTLEAVSPVIRGRVVQAGTGTPLSGAVVQWPQGSRHTRTAADGSFVLPLSGSLFRRTILLLDRSGSMLFGLEPGTEQAAPEGARRLDALKQAVADLVDRIPEGVEVAIWSFTTPDERFYGNFCDPSHARVDQAFTTSRDAPRRTIADFVTDGGTPLTGAVRAVIDRAQADPTSREAVVVLLTDGLNSCEDPSAAEAYRAEGGRMVIHTVGFAIEPGGVAERDLRELARESGGSYHQASSLEELRLVFRSFADTIATDGVTIQVSAVGHRTIELPLADAAEVGEAIEVTLPRMALADAQRVITVGRDNIADLQLVRDLSPKARDMIEQRIAAPPGDWSVTIPTQRVGIGGVTAYGWFETQASTGRVIGRTEDGLHSSSAADLIRWPQRRAREQPYVAWVSGITAYTAGSVLAAMGWHRQQDSLQSSPDDFKRFVQSQALEYVIEWSGELAPNTGTAGGDAFWKGVCLNFELQSAALELEGAERCYRAWATRLCEDVLVGAIQSAPGELLAEAVREVSGVAEVAWTVLITAAREAGLTQFADALQAAWERIVNETLDCSSFLEG